MMAISTYDNLVKTILDWSLRDDIDLLIPDFIALAETEMFANNEEILEIRPNEKTATLTAIGQPPENATRFIALPTDLISQRDFRIEVLNSIIPLTFDVPSALRIRPGVGRPCRFTVTSQIELDIVPDQDYTLTMKYFSKPPPLTKTAQVNTIITSDPNIYLYGTLHQIFLRGQDDDEAIKWFSKFIEAIKGANDRGRKGRFGPSPRMKLRSRTP